MRPDPGILDPGIAPFVEALRAAGIETFESCQGGEGHAAVEPIVRFYGDRSEGFRALRMSRSPWNFGGGPVM